MKILQVNNSQLNNQKLSLNFGSYRVPKTAEGFKMIKAIGEKVPTSHIVLQGEHPVIVALCDMAFLKRLKAQKERKAYLDFLSLPDNAPLITVDEFKASKPADLEVKITMNEYKFKLFLDSLTKKDTK